MADLDRFTRGLDWNLLKYCVQIARSGSIGAAATALNVSQPGVSAALRRLEAHVGAPLFVRTRIGVKPTEAGALLLRDAETITALIAAKQQELAAIADRVTGAITVKTVSYVSSPTLDVAVIAFRNRYPEVSLSFAAAAWPQVLAAVENGEAPLGIGFVDRETAGLVYERLGSEHVQIYCGEGHPLFGKTVADLATLADLPFVAFKDGEPPSLVRFRARRGLGERTSGFADSLNEAAWMIGLGLGVGLLPVPVASMEQRFRLWPILPAAMAPQIDIYLVRRGDLSDRPALLLAGMIAERLRS